MNWMVIFARAASALAEDGIVDAAETGHEHVTHVPWSQVGVQAFNLLALVALLVYLLRGAVKAHFAHRSKEYRQLVERAEHARLEAERSKNEIEARLRKLSTGAAEQLREAKSEGDRLRERLLAEGRELSAKLEHEATRSAQIEIEKAKGQLRKELLAEALQSSNASLGKDLSQTEQKKLQDEFAEKIQVVGG